MTYGGLELGVTQAMAASSRHAIRRAQIKALIKTTSKVSQHMTYVRCGQHTINGMAQVLVTSIGKGMQPKRMEMCAALWAQGVKAEFGYKAAPTIKDALGYADDNGIPFVVLFGESELASASVKVCALCISSEAKHNLLCITSAVKTAATGVSIAFRVSRTRDSPSAESCMACTAQAAPHSVWALMGWNTAHEGGMLFGYSVVKQVTTPRRRNQNLHLTLRSAVKAGYLGKSSA